MAYEGFDWKGYLAYAGYPENEIPENVTDEELAQIRDHWARTVYQEELAIAAQDPFLETKKEREEAARNKLLALAPEYRQAFGLKEAQPAEAAFSADEFREHVLNNPVQDAPLDYYLKTFAAKRIGKNTKYEYPYLEGLTKKDFEDLFMERNGIDPDLTTIEDIRNGNFGPAWMAQRAEEESNLPKGSAMRQGWLTFKKLTGLTTETFGDALGIEWMRNIGKGITENAIKTIEEEGYRSKYGESLVDTFKAQGPFAAAGKVLEMAQENWATTGVPLALAGMSALFGIAARNPRLAAQGLAGARASLAAATSADVAMGTGAAATVGRVGASTIAKSLAFASALASGLEVGATREELEEQSKKTGKQLYDPSDPGDVVAWGLLSAALDHVGNMMTFVGGGGLVRAAKGLVQSQQTRMIGAAEAAIRQAGREAGKSWGRKVVEAMGTEGITEALQEYANIMPARNKGVEYTPKEIRDRMIDAGAVGAFMGGGMRGVQALTERKPSTQSESDTTTPQQQTQTPPPNVPSAPNQPPPPGFNVASNTNYAEIEGGWAAWDGYNTGYGNTKEEASQAIIDQSNKNKDTIDPANVTSTANESRVSFGNGGEIVVTGNGHKKVIGDIISLHNANDNVVNLDGTKTHNFDATTLSGLSAEALRNRIEHSGKTAIPDTRSVRKARADQVDIAINYRGEKRDSNGNLIGYRAELVLDDATRNQLAAKGYRILGSQFNNDVQTVQLYRDGQIYHIELTTNGNEVSSTLFTKKILGNLDARVESELSTQKHRITDVGGAAKEVQNFLSVSSAVRSGGIQIERTGAGADAKFVNRKALENFVKKQGGKVVKSTDRSITYELGGETLRFDLQANGDVVVSRNGRFLGAYQFDGSDLGNGMERATYDLTNDVAPVTRFSAQDVYEGLGYRRASNRSQNVLFVKDNESGDYYVIKVSNKGKVDAVVVPYDPNGFFARLEALDSMSTIEDVRQVYQDQFRSGYVEFVDFGGGNLGMRSRSTGLMTDDINDVQMLTSDEVDDIINNPSNPNYNPRLMENLVKVVGISQYTSSTSTTPARIVDWVTVDDVAGVRAFIERAKGYGAIIADYDSTGNNISVKDKAWNAPGSFNADAAGLGLTDLYEEDYLNFDPDVHIDNLVAQGTTTARAEIEEDIKKVAKATRKAFKDMRDLLSRSSTYLPSVTNADIGIIESAYRSTFNRRPRYLATTAQKAKDIRRHFYRARLLQARLHIDVLMANPEFYANRVIEAELRRLQAYDPNWSNDEVRFAAAEAEEIALRLEEEFLNLREMQVSTSISRQIWNAIYPGNSGVEYGSFIERIHNQGNDFRFSRDVNALCAERHMSLLDELRNHPFIGNGALSDLIDSGKLILLETQQEIEDALLRERGYKPMFSELGNIQGFASNDNMRVYLSSWGIKQGDAFRVLLHEMGAHTRRFGFSEAEFQEILAGIKANSTAQTPEGRHIRHAMWRAQNAKVSPNDPHYWEEVAAYLVEDSNEYAGLGILDTMQAWVKRWLFTNGYIDATNFHYQDFTIFSLGMFRDSRIPLRLLNGKFDYSRHQNRIYDTRKFVESYVTEDIAKQLGYSREEVIEMVAAHLAGTYKAGNHVIGDLPDEDELMSHFPTIDADWRVFDRDDSASDLRFSRDMETAIAEARDEVLRPHLPPAGVQKDASVIYPNAADEIANIRFSKKSDDRLNNYKNKLLKHRGGDLSLGKIDEVADRLVKYNNEKKEKAMLHWIIAGSVDIYNFERDEYNVDKAIEAATLMKRDIIADLSRDSKKDNPEYNSPLDYIEEYLKSRPEGAPIRPEQLEKEFRGIFTKFVNHGGGIVSYEVDDSKKGQEAMRKIMNTHWGKSESPWCLLQANNQGELKPQAWKFWNEYNTLPKRVAFKDGNLISFMATAAEILTPSEALDSLTSFDFFNYANRPFKQYYNTSSAVRSYIDNYNMRVSISYINLILEDGEIYNKENRDKIDYVDMIPFVMSFMPEYMPERVYSYSELVDSIKYNKDAWKNAVLEALDILEVQKEDIYNELSEWVKEEFKIEYKTAFTDNDIAYIVDSKGEELDLTYTLYEIPTKFYKMPNGKYIPDVPEEWWDEKNKSHFSLEWAKVDPEVGRIRFSIAGEIGEQETILPEGTIRFSVADVARLTYDFGNYKDISLKQFTDRFQKYITNRDNTMEDVERICADYIKNVHSKPADFVPQLDPRKRNYLRYFFIENGESRGQLYDDTNAKHNRDASDQQRRVIALYRESLSEKDFNRLYELLSIPRNEQTKEQKDEISALDSRARFGDLTQKEIDRFSELFIAGRDGELDSTENLPLEDQQFLADFFDSTIEEDQKRRKEDKEFSKLKSRISNFGNGILDEIKIINEERNKAIESLAQYFKDNTDYHSTEKALILWGAMRYAITERMVNNDELEVKLWKLSDDNDARVMVVPGEWTAKIVDHLRRGASYEDALIKASKEMKEINAAKRGVPVGFTGWKVYEQNDSYEAGQELQQAVAGTGWCTGAAVSTAQIHRTGGDFHVYFENGNPIIAIRTENGRMAEPPRGAHKGQFCTPEEEAIAEEYIRTGGKIAAGDDYLKDREDIRRLASGEMTWQEAFMMPPQRRYENGEFGGDTKEWPEGVKTARIKILSKYEKERHAAGYFFHEELYRNENEVIYLNFFGDYDGFINGKFPNLKKILGYNLTFGTDCEFPLLEDIELIGNLRFNSIIELKSLVRIKSEYVNISKKVHTPNLKVIEGFAHITSNIPSLENINGNALIVNDNLDLHNLRIVDGNLEIKNENPNLSSLTNVGGNLIVDSGAFIIFPELLDVRGEFLSNDNTHLPKLVNIGGNTILNRVTDVPNLTTIGGNAHIYEESNVPSLTTIEGDTFIESGVKAPELKVIKGNATIRNGNVKITDVSKLITIGGDAIISSRLYLGSLRNIGGNVYFDRHVDVHSLENIGGNAKISEQVNASALINVGGELLVQSTADISALTNVGGDIYVYTYHGLNKLVNNIEELRREMGVRFSIAQQPTTPEQGTAIPNAPGMYKMRNGTIQAHPEYIPPGLETETAIYAAVAISDIAKNEPGLEDVRAMINADEVLREEVLAELSQRGIEDTRDNEFLYAIRNVLQTREPEDPTYQAIVDVFHEAITKATGGIQDDILLTDSDIAAAAHAITNTPFEPLIGEPVPTVPTPKPTVFDQMEANWAMMQSTIDEAVANVEVSERETPIIRYSIAGVDMRLDGVEGYNGVDGRQKLYAELEQIYGSTHQWNEWDSFYNQLAAAQITGTQEVHDVGALAAPADSNRGLVDQFLNAALPDYLKDKIQIEWTMTPDAVKNLNGGLASFDPRGGAADKLIYIQGWGRTVGQVIRSAAWELSRFGWNAAPGAMTNLKKPLVELYNLHESAIYQELSPYYTKYKINRANVSDKHKIFLVQTYFAKMNQDILTGNPNALAQQIGIDPATYKRIHDEIVQNINTATTDLTNYIENYTAIATDPEIAKAFTQDILRLIMGGMHGRGAAFVYETANSAGPSDTIYAYTNDFGLHRKFLKPECNNGKNRYACIADEIKQNLKWWRETFEPWGLGELAENFCRFFLRNFPMHNGLSFLHLNVPSAHLGDTTITKATSLISRIWQRVDDPHGIEIREKLKVMERIHAILRDHNYDARWTENATNGYEALFRSLGITDEKSIATAQLADRALPDLQAMIQRNAAEIRADFAMTIDSLVTHMSTSRSIPEREIENMIQRMNNYAESFLGDYEHRTYEAYSLDGLDELIAMKHDLNIDPNTGELTIHAKAAAAQKFISDTEQRLGGRNAEFYKQTEEARNIVRRASRLDSLRKYKQAKITNSHRGLTGGELDERVIKEMNDELGKLIDDVREMRTADRGIYKKFNYIPGAKRRKLDERIEADREYMNFLGRVTDPLMNAIYSIDQQKKILEKLHFNRELGEHIISSGMGEIRGDAVSSSVGEGTIKDISTLEGGTFLEYIRVYPEFQKEINAEYRINSKVRDSVLGGVIDVWKANNTIYSLRLGINNYVGNFSMLLASGHLWRFANIFQAGQITKRQFLERFTTNVNGLDATTQELYEEMRSARVVGGTMSEMNVMAYGRGVHEKVIGFFLKHLRDADVLSSQGKFVAETWVNSFLEKMKTFYAFGDEWVKPLMYLNNRANAIAKWESKLDPNAPEFEGDVTEWRKEVRRRAIEEAAEQTIRESVSWENSPQFIRWLSQKNLRIFTPDFLMHNFQMLRITASNFLRLGECFRELNSLEVNNERDANYKDALVKEIAQRGVGGAMTTAVYAGLMGATGSVMAFVPYMINVLFNNIEGEGDDDDKKGMFFGPDEWEGAQRLVNYKTGGNNLFVPVFKSGDKIYAWNYVRSSVMLTHAPVRPPTDDPTFTDYGAVIMRNIVDLSNGTMTQQLINNMMGKDRFGREIGIVEGWGRVLERTLVPGFARQLVGVTLGYPLSDNMFHEGRAIKIPDLLGITVNAYDPRDVANHLAYDINSHNTDRNIHRRNFVEQLSKSDRLSDRQIVGMIADMRERNARDLSKANYVVTGLRQVGMTDREIVHWLTHNRKTGGDALARKHAVGLLKGKDIYDEALITTLVNKRNQLNEGPQNLRMSKDELAVVNANLDKAIRMYKQALRVQ